MKILVDSSLNKIIVDSTSNKVIVDSSPKKMIVDSAFNSRIKKAFIFDPKSNSRNSVIYDPLNSLAIGFDGDDSPYYPVGDSNAIDEIVLGKNGFQGLVIGSEVIGFECFHCHGNTYRLTNFN